MSAGAGGSGRRAAPARGPWAGSGLGALKAEPGSGGRRSGGNTGRQQRAGPQIPGRSRGLFQSLLSLPLGC